MNRRKLAYWAIGILIAFLIFATYVGLFGGQGS
jgi:hypothetical protein